MTFSFSHSLARSGPMANRARSRSRSRLPGRGIDAENPHAGVDGQLHGERAVLAGRIGPGDGLAVDGRAIGSARAKRTFQLGVGDQQVVAGVFHRITRRAACRPEPGPGSEPGPRRGDAPAASCPGFFLAPRPWPPRPACRCSAPCRYSMPARMLHWSNVARLADADIGLAATWTRAIWERSSATLPIRSLSLSFRACRGCPGRGRKGLSFLRSLLGEHGLVEQGVGQLVAHAVADRRLEVGGVGFEPGLRLGLTFLYFSSGVSLLSEILGMRTIWK